MLSQTNPVKLHVSEIKVSVKFKMFVDRIWFYIHQSFFQKTQYYHPPVIQTRPESNKASDWQNPMV